MSEFKDITLIKKGNIYFDGKVVSRSIIFPNGEKKTLGFMQIGEYEFSTELAEVMEIQSGKLKTKIADSEWKEISSGESFSIPANSNFKMIVSEVTDYICSFIK